jgi:hypothetical protein
MAIVQPPVVQQALLAQFAVAASSVVGNWSAVDKKSTSF